MAQPNALPHLHKRMKNTLNPNTMKANYNQKDEQDTILNDFV